VGRLYPEVIDWAGMCRAYDEIEARDTFRAFVALVAWKTFWGSG
jgi:hypothetical protein